MPTNANTQAPTPARYKIVGHAFVIVSKLKTDIIKKLRKYEPTALNLYEDRDGELVQIFGIDASKNSAFNKHGIVYGSTNDDGYAVATITIPESVNDKKAFVKDEYGTALLMLEDIENTALTAHTALETRLASLDNKIMEV